MRRPLIVLLASGAFVATSGAVLAHHSFAMFDQENPIELEGLVQEFKFTSPHTFIIPTGQQEDGRTQPGASKAARRAPWSGRLVEQDPEAGRRAEDDDRAVAKRRARRRLDSGQDQIQRRAADRGQPLSIRPALAAPPPSPYGRTRCFTGARSVWSRWPRYADGIRRRPAHDESKYPDWSGQWLRTGGIQWIRPSPSVADSRPP